MFCGFCIVGQYAVVVLRMEEEKKKNATDDEASQWECAFCFESLRIEQSVVTTCVRKYFLGSLFEKKEKKKKREETKNGNFFFF